MENCHDSHKPVEIDDLWVLTIQVRHGIPRSPTRRGKAADGPLTARKRVINL